MASEFAQKVAGTYIADSVGPLLPVHLWTLRECRSGRLARHIARFCLLQAEALNPGLVQVESVTPEAIFCRVPCRLYDHESLHPYTSEVRFSLNPVSGETKRIS